MVGGELVNQLSGVEGAGGKLKVALEGEEAVDGLAAGYGIQIPSPSQRHLAIGEKLKVS
ncbi:unnamed protein product [marine sediment metagenome]|uniref:Uncharacterized protein n=1 Tax=marine sediment metagenome TaxID=412755 RepID=X1I5E4_9ZZZZ